MKIFLQRYRKQLSIALVLLIAVISAAGFYFCIYIPSPRHSLALIEEAARQGNKETFDEMVDTERLSESIFDALATQAAWQPSEPQPLLQLTLLPMKKEFAGQAKTYVDSKLDNTSDEPAATAAKAGLEKRLKGLGFPLSLGSWHYGSAANFKTINDNTAQCDLTFHNDTLAADLTASVSLERLDSKRWRIISVTEFQSFLKQTQTAYEKKLAALNKPTQDKIDGALRIENLKAELIHNNTASPAFTYIRLHYMMKQQGQLNDIKGIRLHYELHDQQDGSLLYQANTIFVPTGQFGQRTSQFTISPLRRGYYALAQRPDLSQTTSALTITAIYFKDGTNWQLETVLPN